MTALGYTLAIIAAWVALDILLLPLWIAIGRAIHDGNRHLGRPLPPASLTGGRPFMTDRRD